MLAIKAWNMLGGLEWTGFETVCEMLDIDDPHGFALRLAVIRDFQRERK